MAHAAADEWDAVWAAYDARQPRPAEPPPAAPPSRLGRAIGRGRLLAAGLAVLAASYLATPIAAAVSLAGAVQRADAFALSERVEWPVLRAGVEAALLRDAERHGPMPPFIHAMAATMAERVASPTGLATLLNGRTDRPEAGRQLVRDLMPEGLGRWRVTLGAAAQGQRNASLTLAMTGALQWNVVGLAMPGR